MSSSGFPSRLVLCAAWLCLAAPILRAGSPPPKSPDALIDLLFSAPQFENGQLSPDGTHLALGAEYKNRKVISTYDFATRKLHTAGGNFRQNVFGYAWTGPDELLLEMGDGLIYYVGLWSVDANLGHLHEIESLDQIAYTIVDALPQVPGKALLRENPRAGFYSQLYVLQTKKHNVEVAESNPGKVIDWLADLHGVPRLRISAGEAGAVSFEVRDAADAAWRDEALPKGANPLSFDPSGRYLLIAYPNADRRFVIQTYDLQAHALIGGPISDPVYSLDPRVLRDPRSGAPIGLYCEKDKPAFIWLDPQYQKLHDLLQGSFPGQTVGISGPLADGRILFAVAGDVTPPAYYALDLSQHAIDPLLNSRPEAAKVEWAPMQPVAFTARDGWPLHGYLTLPRGWSADHPVPMVAVVHGGPQVRDTWGFDPEVQFLAALGYGVLQVDYRGSTGYSEAHELTTNLDVCEKSVDDVVDGLRWAVAQHYADPKALVTYGGSYGGYISLAVATRYPELPAAVVGYAGVYDWVEQMKNDRIDFKKLMRWKNDYFVPLAGHEEAYRKFSPANFAAAVKCPVLLMHGSDDQRVAYTQTKIMASALASAGKDVQVVKDVEGIHGLPLSEARQEFYRRLASFLLAHVPPHPAS